MNLVALGTIALDTVETPFGRRENILGGSVTYFSLAASFFTKCGVVGVVGRDFPSEHFNVLRRRGIDTAGVEYADGDTFRWEGFYEYDMNQAHTKRTDLNVLASFDPKIPKEYKNCKYLFLANTDPEIQLKVLNEVKPTYSFCDTMNYWINSKKEVLTEVLSKVDMAVINEGEARQYCGTPNLIKCGRTLLDSGVKKVIIKKGEHGALYFSEGEFFTSPAYPIENVVDPTGAGDSFAGGTIGHLAKHGTLTDADIKKSMILGAVIASYVVEGFSIDAIKNKTQADIEGRYREFRKIVAFDHQMQ
ncbi:putative sugar kinase [uncultured archaeon]|nr:putative sugar kinase [uncultured archaeon]